MTRERQAPREVDNASIAAGHGEPHTSALALRTTEAAPAAVLALQRTAGNYAVTRMLQRADAGAPAADAGTASVPAWTARTMPGPRTGLTILTELDNICGRMKAAGYDARIGSGRRTIDEQIQLYAKGRTFATLKADLAAAVTAGSVTAAKAKEWTDYYDPAVGGNAMPAGEPGPVTWTFTSRHLTGDAADVVDKTLGWSAAAGFWTALNTAAVAEGLQIGPPASDVAHVQRP
jgi:hypothetical protein